MSNWRNKRFRREAGGWREQDDGTYLVELLPCKHKVVRRYGVKNFAFCEVCAKPENHPYCADRGATDRCSKCGQPVEAHPPVKGAAP